MASVHLQARSTSKDSYRLDVEEPEEIMFAMIAPVLRFTHLLMPHSTPHCMRMATSTLGFLQEVVRMKISVSVSIAGQDIAEVFTWPSFLHTPD